MTCKPRDIENDSKAIAKRLYPERMVGHPSSANFFSDADAGQRLHAEQIIKHLMKNGAIFPWDINDIPEIPAP